MKTTTKFITFFIALLCLSNLTFGANDAKFTESGLQKYYIQGCDVKVANNGIFVNFEGDILRVNAMFVDEVGVYIIGLGSCRYCGRPNDDLGHCQNPRCKNYGK